MKQSISDQSGIIEGPSVTIRGASKYQAIREASNQQQFKKSLTSISPRGFQSSRRDKSTLSPRGRRVCKHSHKGRFQPPCPPPHPRSRRIGVSPQIVENFKRADRNHRCSSQVSHQRRSDNNRQLTQRSSCMRCMQQELLPIPHLTPQR